MPRVEGVEHPAIKLTSPIANTLNPKARLPITFLNALDLKIMIANLLDEYPMILFALEGGLALALLLFIVLWTGKGKK